MKNHAPTSVRLGPAIRRHLDRRWHLTINIERKNHWRAYIVSSRSFLWHSEDGPTAQSALDALNKTLK
jgi:hypothetical protein